MDMEGYWTWNVFMDTFLVYEQILMFLESVCYPSLKPTFLAWLLLIKANRINIRKIQIVSFKTLKTRRLH